MLASDEELVRQLASNPNVLAAFTSDPALIDSLASNPDVVARYYYSFSGPTAF